MTKVLQSYDGWTVVVKGKTYRWDHNEEDMGTKALMTMLTDLGYEPEFEEVY